MSKQHCSLSYHKAHLDELDVFAVGVRDGIFNNTATFATPPVTQVDFQTLIDNYVNTRGAYVQGGLAQKGPFQAAKAALMAGLDTMADYVDEIANGNENIILLAGFVPTKPGNTEPHVPAQTEPAKITRGATGELYAEVPNVPGADYYGCIVFAGMPMPSQISMNAVGQLVVVNTENPGPEPEPRPAANAVIAAFDLTKSRKKKFVGLQTHMVYYFYFYAANATGVSPLSVVSSLECI